MKKTQRASKAKALAAAELDALHDAGVDLSAHVNLDQAARPGRAVQRGDRHPLIGWLRGTVTVAEGVDLTEPADPEWGEAAHGDRTSDSK